MKNQFNLKIKLSKSSTMSDRGDVIAALQKTIDQLTYGQSIATVYDINGNSVGAWSFNIKGKLNC